MEKSDEFDEWMLNHQNFPYQDFALKNFRHCIFYGDNLLTSFVMVVLVISGLLILKNFHPILDKKDSPEDKELYSIHLEDYTRHH